MATVPNHAPSYILFHFFWTYAITSTRPIKNIWGLDHNVAPREDITRFGEKAVEAGKLKRAQLNMLKRNEASHANTIEQLPYFLASVLLGIVAKVPNDSINRVCLLYTGARVVYHACYLMVERGPLAALRSVVWWVGNLACLWLVWQCKDALN